MAIVWYLKCRDGVSSRDQQKLQGIENEGGGGGGDIVQDEGVAAERVPLKEEKKSLGKNNGLSIANNGGQVTNKTPKKSSKQPIIKENILIFKRKGKVIWLFLFKFE